MSKNGIAGRESYGARRSLTKTGASRTESPRRVTCPRIVPSLVKGEMSAVTKLVLDERKVDPNLAIFRLAESPSMVLLRGDAAASLERAGFTACLFVDVAQFER